MKPLIASNGKYNYNALRALTERHETMIRKRIRALCIAGGLPVESSGFPSLILHNALCDQHSRTGWGQSVTDYKALRRARYLEDTVLFRASHVLTDLYKRLGHERFNWE